MKRIALLGFLVSLSIVLAACAAPQTGPTAAPTSSSTPTSGAVVASVSGTPAADLCSPANLPTTVLMIHNFKRQFNSYATLATTVAQSDLIKIIPAMQAIRRDTDAQSIPPCLTNLKRYALQYMDSVIKTLQDFQKSPNIQTLNAGIIQARQYSDEYDKELATLAGVTLQPNPTSGTPPTAAAQPAVTSTPAVATITNPGPNALNLHVSPSLTAQSIGVLDANLSTTAIGKSADGEFLLVQVPNQAGKTAWVYASLVQFTAGEQGALPVATP